MAPPAGTLRIGRYFLALAALFAILYSIVAFGTRHAPKLGLDLVGGVRVIFTAQTPKGEPAPTSDQMTQARQILEDRINTTGVTGSTVVVQGGNQLVVEIPNGTSTDVAALGKAAILNFRGVVAPAQPVVCRPAPGGVGGGSPGASSGAAPSASHSPGSFNERRLPVAAKPSKQASGSATPVRRASGSTQPRTSPSASASPPASSTGAPPSQSAPICNADPFNTPIKLAGPGSPPFGGKALFAFDPSLKAKMPNAESCPSPALSGAACTPYTALSATQQQEIATALRTLDCGSTSTEPDIATSYYYACDDGRIYGTKVAYLLGHVVVPGKLIDTAAAQAPNAQNGEIAWTVSLKLTTSGGDRWNAWTSKFNTTDKTATALATGSSTPCGAGASVPCSDFVGFTLDGVVISAPVTQAALDINTSISGNFTQGTAKALAKELNYGKLPVSFRADANQHVSATLGSRQLNAAFLAGGIGLLLVVLYSLIYYRGLGLVTIASLLVSAGLTFAMLVLLSTQIGFTLDLSGIAGFIVALGITADSFVVFFERLKDEVHGGRSVRVAVPRAWTRARRTILSADTVSFLAAAILYFFASADVKGFAFTLGMSTILDLVVVFLFTHQIVSLLSRTRTFGSPAFTGLNALRTGVVLPDEEEPARRRPSRAAPASSSGGADTASAEPSKYAGTVLIEKDERPSGRLAEPDDAVESEPEVESDGEPDTEPDGAPEKPRRRTAPEPGSAAARAAARRARLRNPTEGDR
ncbi:MAG: protein translocase subunit SecD [Jatrophihabitantaceae bacterium]